jgi:hypothetical protein
MLLAITPFQFVLTMAVILLVIGVITFGAGVFIVVIRVMGEDVRTIANQTARLAQKGIADDVAGLVGNASALLDSLNELVRTSAGMGVFLIMTSLLLFLSAYLMITHLV